MAALDFPVGSTVGQTFSAANGVVYTWNGTLWLASSGSTVVSDTAPVGPAVNQLWFNSLLGQLLIYYNDGNTSQWVPASPNMNVPTSPGGDFSAVSTASITLPTSFQVLVLTTINSGNSGGWYNTTSGRYTPPAGRYFLAASLTGQAIGATGIVFAQLTKNGSQIAYGFDTAYSASSTSSVSLSATVDANGTDYFELQAYCNVAGSITNSPKTVMFSGFPLSGIKGPTGNPAAGALTLYNESVLAASAADIRVTIPTLSTCKKVELEFMITTVGGANGTLALGSMIGSTPDVSVGIYSSQTTYSAATGVNAFLNNTNSWLNLTCVYAGGSVRAMYLPFNNSMMGDLTLMGQDAGGAKYQWSQSMMNGPPGNTVTGFRIFNANGVQFLAGSYMRSFVVV
jgi:hypothetical protein